MPMLVHHTRGVKRKRLNDKEDKEAKLRRKLHHAFRELGKIVKKARTFEVRKTLKRLRDARHKNPEGDMTTDLEAQIKILKHLGCDQLARSALVTKLNKDKTLSADPTIRAIADELALGLVSHGTPGTPTAKVYGRILSSKMLAMEVMSVVQALRALVQPQKGLQGVGETVDDSRGSLTIWRTGNGRERDGHSSKDNGFGEGRDEGHVNTSGDEAVAEVDDSWESGTASDHAPSESDDREAYDHGSGGTDDVFKGQSEFLPVLSVGYNRGDESGSEFSDEPKGRKRNRRGQRARRAIWEKKFGKNAHHIRSAVTERRQPGPVPVDRRSAKRNSSAPLHPSWEAKRKQQNFILPSQGTKVIFSN